MKVSRLRPGERFRALHDDAVWVVCDETCVVPEVHRGGGVSAHICRVASCDGKRKAFRLSDYVRGVP